jgi:hypothetical protein
MEYSEYLDAPDEVIEALDAKTQLNIFRLLILRVRVLTKSDPTIRARITQTLGLNREKIDEVESEPVPFIVLWRTMKKFEQEAQKLS